MCDGTSYQLTASGAQKYEWSPASSLDNSHISSPHAFPSQNTTNMLVAWEGSCIPDTHYVDMIVHPKPIVNAGNDQTIVAGASASLQGSGTGIIKYMWLNDGTLNCDNCSNPVANPKKTTTYILTGYTNYGCTDSDRVTVFVLCDKSQMFVPNTFTPNGDGHNDYFYPRGTGIDQIRSMRVYNRWGEVVYEKTSFVPNDKASGWDGKFKGTELRPDVFVYLIEATCENGDPITFKGDVTLVK
jgi:gliding motility-associated-like protein